jgi:hypothetical protein
MSTIDPRPKRRIITSLKLNEISSVDRPAQAGARMVLMKRDTPLVEQLPPDDQSGREILAEDEVVKIVEAIAAERAKISGKTMQQEFAAIVMNDKGIASLLA